MTSGPKLSIVIPTRNDNYAGGMARRLQFSLDILVRQLESRAIPSEIVLVEWNPPSDRPLLREAIWFPGATQYCSIRVVVVPAKFHRRYEYWEKRPIHSAVAFNVGIRRARGQFILPRVSDAIYSGMLMDLLASEDLRKDMRYRCDRCDVEEDVLNFEGSDEKDVENYCRNHVLIRYIPLRDPGLPNLHTNACGDFQLASRDTYFQLRGLMETRDVASQHVDGLFSFASYAAGVREHYWEGDACVYKIAHKNLNNQRIKQLEWPFESFMARSRLPSIVKRLLCGGYKRTFGDAGIEVHGVRLPPWSHYVKFIREILDKKRSFVLNGEDWGLGKLDLPDHRVTVASWEQAANPWLPT